jgi:hypothetical protein
MAMQVAPSDRPKEIADWTKKAVVVRGRSGVLLMPPSWAAGPPGA